MILTKDEIIEIQSQIIKEFKCTSLFLNGVFMDVIRTYKDKPNRTDVETALMNFAGDSNDCLVDQPKIDELLKKLDEHHNEPQIKGYNGIVGDRKKPLVIKYE